MKDFNPYDYQDTITEDIRMIDKVLQSQNYELLKKTHRKIDGKYQAFISEWETGMWGYNPNFGFDLDALSTDSLTENLEMMRAKLEGLLCGFNCKTDGPNRNQDFNLTVNNNNSNTNTNTMEVHNSFDYARDQIENMTALNREETDEIIEKINELESVAKEKSSRKNKWEKVKPILKFALDKGIDIALVLFTIVVQNNMLR